jgi:hypothetical protein
VNAIKPEQLDRCKRRILSRLANSADEDRGRPMFQSQNVQYEFAERIRGFAEGGIGAIHAFAEKIGLVKAIDRHVHLLKIHKPYHESDHVLNLAYNALVGGSCLEDLELRRNNEVFLDALGTERCPDPTTAGDFCRRFFREDIYDLMDAFDEVRLGVWKRQPAEFFRQAVVDMDGTIVPTTGECKQGMDISYKKIWGYHLLLVSLANTGEVLSIVNRPGNRPSQEGAAAEADRAIALCKKAGFRKILLRGDTDFSQTTHLDRWDDDPQVTFIFGLDASCTLQRHADELPEKLWEFLERPEKYAVKTVPRRRPIRWKQKIVEARGYEDIRLESEWIAEFEYSPSACKKTYRLVAVCKNLKVKDRQMGLFHDYRYFFYITNDRTHSAEEIVFSANDRCHQENLIEQQKNGVRSFRAPVDNLLSNWAYMVMTSLAWNLKAWFALSLPEQGRWQEKHRQEKQLVLRMEFKRFVKSFIQIPCQLVKTGRRLVYRILAWNPYLHIFSRFLTALRE